jgi:hypothetical protein
MKARRWRGYKIKRDRVKQGNSCVNKYDSAVSVRMRPTVTGGRLTVVTNFPLLTVNGTFFMEYLFVKAQ